MAAPSKNFRSRHIDRAGSNTSRRFIDNFCTYVKLVGEEAELQESNEVLGVHGYIALRRETSAVHTCFDLMEYCLGITLRCVRLPSLSERLQCRNGSHALANVN